MSNLEVASQANLPPEFPPSRPARVMDDELFASCYDDFPQPVWLVSSSTLRLLRVNRTMCAELSMSASELTNLTEAELCRSDEVPRMQQLYGRESREDSGWSAYRRHQRQPDGTFSSVQLRFAPVIYEGQPAQLVVAHSLRQRRQDAALRQQIDILKSLVANSGYGLGRYCLTRKKLVFFNQHLLDLMGCTDEVTPGLPALAGQLSDYIGQSFANGEDWQAFLDAAAARQTFQKIVLWRSQTGLLRYMRLHGVPIETPDGVQMDLSVEDATEAVRHEQQFRQSQKMEALGRMAGGVAHDFNNLLLVIRGHAELMEEELEPHSELRHHTTRLITASRQAADITGTLLTFSRGEEPLLGLLPLNETIRTYAQMMPSFLRSDVLLDVDLATDEFYVLANATHVEQVVLNLCINARDAMPKGGRLTVRTQHIPADVPAGHGSVMLEVSDTGVGMDAETRAHLFEPFYTTKARGKGTGLGLALVYGIVTQYEGRIEVETEIGRGTSFRIYFPLGEQVRREAPRPPTGLPKQTVLLVDDQSEIRNMVGDFLKKLGYEVLCAGDGRAALELARSHAGKIDLLMTDVMMPHMNGFELTVQLKKERPGIAVLLMSGYTSGALSRRGKDLGNAPFLAKPFSMRQLQTSLEVILGAMPQAP